MRDIRNMTIREIEDYIRELENANCNGNILPTMTIDGQNIGDLLMLSKQYMAWTKGMAPIGLMDAYQRGYEDAQKVVNSEITEYTNGITATMTYGLYDPLRAYDEATGTIQRRIENVYKKKDGFLR